jgi:hypothetical protein
MREDHESTDEESAARLADTGEPPEQPDPSEYAEDPQARTFEEDGVTVHERGAHVEIELSDLARRIEDTDLDRSPTPEELERHRRWQCRTQGHSFTTIGTYRSLDPRAIICDRCGKEWKVCPCGCGCPCG